MPNNLPILFFDLETTGLDNEKDEIIQLACLATSGYPEFQVVNKFNTRVMPTEKGKARLKESIETGGNPVKYTDKAWEGAPSEKVVMTHFKVFCKKYAKLPRKSRNGGTYYVAQLLAHNASFDKGFILAAAKRHNMFLPANLIMMDSLQLAMFVGMITRNPFESLKLGALCEEYEVPLTNAHDALADVEALVMLTRELFADLESEAHGKKQSK